MCDNKYNMNTEMRINNKHLKKGLSVVLAVILIVALMPSHFVSAMNVNGWRFVTAGGCEATGELDYDTKYFGACSFKIVNKSAQADNVYARLSALDVPVKQGKTYEYGFWAKGYRANNVFTLIDWGERHSILPIGGTYDWMKFTFRYTHTTSTPTVTVNVNCDNTTKSVWLDGFEMYELDENGRRVGANLIKNPNFDGSISQSSGGGNAKESKLSDMVSSVQSASGEFDGENYFNALGGFRLIPVKHADEISIDGSTEDWNEDYYSFELPISDGNYQDYTKDGKNKDLKANVKCAYDDRYLYLGIATEDDEHKSVLGSNYWQGDSVQIVLGSEEEVYGTEFGIMYDPETDFSGLYNLSDEQAEQVIYKAKKEDNTVTYELAVPWTVKWESRPETMLLDLGFNDNDGGKRRYCMEIAPGIAEGKTNAKFPALKFMNGDENYIAWAEGDKEQYLESEGKYCLYIINLGNKNKFNIKTNPVTDEINEEINSGKGRRFDLSVPFNSLDINNIEININGDSIIKSVTVNPTSETYQPQLELLRTRVDEIKGLIEQCNKNGINTDYEDAALFVMNKFISTIESHISNNYYKIMDYTFEKLEDIYNEAKDNLTKYLNGEKTPFFSPKYAGGRLTYNGPVIYADMTTDDGGTENRPAFFVGYGHFGTARNEIPNFSKFGMNVNQAEIAMSDVIQGGSTIDGWQIIKAATGEVTPVETDGTESGYAVKFVNKSRSGDNIYLGLSQYFGTKANTEYEISFKAKATNAGKFWLSANGFDSRFSIAGSYDWKEYSFTYTTGASSSQRFMIVSDDITDEMLIGDLKVCEVGTDKNILENSDFAVSYEEAKEFDTTLGKIGWVREYLENAKKNNVLVSLLLSPHYFPDFVLKNHPEMQCNNDGFLKFNVMDETAKGVVEEFIRAVVPMVKEYDCVSNIVISNEPQFFSALKPDFYAPYWQEHLKNTYSDINELNAVCETEYSDWSEVPMVTSGAENSMLCYDYLTFNNNVFTEWHAWMAGIVKEIAPDMPVSAKVMSNIGTADAKVKSGSNGIDYEKLSESFDMNGNDSHNYLDYGDKYLAKTMWYDFLTSMKNVTVNNSEDHIIQDAHRYLRDSGSQSLYDGVYYNSDMQAPFVSADIWQGAVHKRGISTIWLWDNSYNTQDDKFGSIYNRPDCIYQISKATLDLNRLSKEIEGIENTDADVAILYSLPSRMKGSGYENTMYTLYSALLFNGKKVKFVTDNKIDNVNKYKMIFIPNAEVVSEDVLDGLNKYKNNGGKIVIIGDTSLSRDNKNHILDSAKRQAVFNGSRVIDAEINISSEGTEILTSPSLEEMEDIISDILTEENISYIKLLDAQSGEQVKNVEWEYGICDGKFIVNICNYEFDKNKTVKVSALNSDVKEFTELRSGERMSEITLEPYKPVLLSFDANGRFFDMIGHWAENNVSELATRGIVKGRTETLFVPDDNITVAEYLTLILRATDNEPSAYKGGITDVFADAWYSEYVQTGKDLGIIQFLIKNGSLNPDRVITREEAAHLTVNIYERLNGAVEEKQCEYSDISDAEDLGIIRKASYIGILNGYEDNTVRPKGQLTRAESAEITGRLLKQGK